MGHPTPLDQAESDLPFRQSTRLIGLVAWFLTEAGRSFYRPMIYARGIDDWHVADTIGNTMGTIAAVFIILTMSGHGTERDYRLIAGVTAGLVVFELMAPTLGGAVDPWDIGATVLSGLLCAAIYWRLLENDEARHGRLHHQDEYAE